MATTVATIDVGGTGATTAAGALTALGAAPIAAYAQANSAYTAANNASTSANNAVLKAGDTMTGALALSAGNSAAPAITRSGDTDTGIYFPAANEMALTTGGTVAAAFNSNGLFFRNRIINGDMRIDQRNAGAAITTNAYSVDRFYVANNSDGAFSAQQNSSAPAGFVNSFKFTTTTADSSLAAGQYLLMYQGIEGFNTADWGFGTANARTVTLSFWVRSSLTGTFGGSLRNAAATRSYPFSYSISAADTWEYKTVTIPGDTTGTWPTDNGAGAYLFFSLGTGSTFSGTAGAWAATSYVSVTGAVSVLGTLNATWYITGVQLETGSVATPFERRPYGIELMLCQRYYEIIGSPLNVITPNSTYPNYAVATPQFFPKRATPTVSQRSGTSLTNSLDRFGIGAITPSALSFDSATIYSCRVQFAFSTSYGVGETFVLGYGGGTDYIQVSAEL